MVLIRVFKIVSFGDLGFRPYLNSNLTEGVSSDYTLFGAKVKSLFLSVYWSDVYLYHSQIRWLRLTDREELLLGGGNGSSSKLVSVKWVNVLRDFERGA